MLRLPRGTIAALGILSLVAFLVVSALFTQTYLVAQEPDPPDSRPDSEQPSEGQGTTPDYTVFQPWIDGAAEAGATSTGTVTATPLPTEIPTQTPTASPTHTATPTETSTGASTPAPSPLPELPRAGATTARGNWATATPSAERPRSQ